ncbi:GspE/PulE family protein [Arenicella xantha]|uniref:General secretion pathway protein E n=1 Tax=Arenicella xantha TaxID=644221 RepID=A0A395JFN0_9GAMM|nr:GspE/PulE family protein [Arenicella xantha]RBP47146.1 general secretion pathway protein E [Arenicella xantha]
MNHSLYRAALERFTDAGYLSKSLLRDAVEDASQPSLLSLLRHGSIPETVFAQTMCELFDVPLLTAHQLPVQAIAELDALGSFLHQQEVLPIDQSTAGLRLAMVDPSDEFTLKVMRSKCQCAVIPVVAARSDILAGLSRLYRQQVDQVEADSSAQAMPNSAITDIDNESAVVRAVHSLLQRAIAAKASDIHFEPYQQALRVRFRVSGVLQSAGSIDQSRIAPTMARIKLMSGLDVTQRRQPQDGRFKFPADGQLIDMRVSTMPLHDGESAVIRLLDPTLGHASLSELGYRQSVIDCLHAAMRQRQGLIVITGPTGSGKSTTLYALLNRLNLDQLKVISIEDPVEIAMPGINQIQVDTEHGVSFAKSLRSVLRQDPDVIMVGEIRDAETAKLAAQAALTGHLVLTTLHTNSAIETLARLRDFGVPDYLISATLKTVVAQRLVRLSCRFCQTLARGADCEHCQSTGYLGRTAIAEVLPSLVGVDWVNSKASNKQLLKSIRLDNMSLADDAARLLASGCIDELERLRVVGDEALSNLEVNVSDAVEHS